MKHLILLFLFFCSVSCSSNAQEQPVPTSSADTIPAQKITLLFAGDLMQHQAQIDAARTATGYDYTDYFKLIKEEIGKADIAIGNLNHVTIQVGSGEVDETVSRLGLVIVDKHLHFPGIGMFGIAGGIHFLKYFQIGCDVFIFPCVLHLHFQDK